MPFWLHERAFVRTLKSLSLRHRAIVLVSLSALVAAAFYGISWRPYSAALVLHRQLHTQLIKDQASLKCIQNRYTELEVQNHSVAPCTQQNLNSQTMCCDTLLDTFFELTKRCNLLISRINEKIIEKKDHATKRLYVIRGEGEHKNILQFLDLLEQQHLPIKIKHFRVDQGNQENLEFRITISVLNQSQA